MFGTMNGQPFVTVQRTERIWDTKWDIPKFNAAEFREVMLRGIKDGRITPPEKEKVAPKRKPQTYNETRICFMCKVEYTPIIAVQKNCSKECSRKYKNSNRRKWKR